MRYEPRIAETQSGRLLCNSTQGGALNAVDAMNHFFLNHEMFIVGSTYWNMVYGGQPGDILNDEEGLANMDNLAENMVWLMKKIKQEEGKGKYEREAI